MEMLIDTIYRACPIYVTYIIQILAGLRRKVAEIRPWPWNAHELVFMNFDVRKYY